jgi:hypothetical protein
MQQVITAGLCPLPVVLRLWIETWFLRMIGDMPVIQRHTTGIDL